MKNLMIINPISHNGVALELRPKIEETLKAFNIKYDIHISSSAENITETVRKNLNNYSNFISVGGDGTLHHIANAIAKTDRNLGSIPLGSGNDIARSLKIPDDIEKCCRAIKNSNTKKIDLGLINNKYYYLGVSGAGFDSIVTDLANNSRFPIKGPSKYSYAVYKTLITFTSKKFKISFNDNKQEINAMMITIGNTDMYGGGMKITPRANPFDGLLDICILKRMTKIHFIKTFPTVFEGKHINDPFVGYFQAKKIEMDSEYNFSVFADGEYICKLPVKYEIAPKALNFIVA
jgi:YegS/Rv2252/BmrU family lipid kinase